MTDAIATLDYGRHKLRGWVPSHSVDPDWLNEAGRIEWQRTKSVMYRAIDHVRVAFRRAGSLT